MELEKILPNNGPSIDEVKKYNDLIFISPSNISPEFTNNVISVGISLESQLKELVSSPSGERDALVQWMMSNQALFTSRGGDMSQLLTFNKDSKGEIGLFLNAMNTAYNDAPFTTDTPEELLNMDILDYDGYTEGEGLTSLLSNEVSDVTDIDVNLNKSFLDFTIFPTLEKEKITYEGRLSDQIKAIKMINDDETLKLHWQLYNFSGFDKNQRNKLMEQTWSIVKNNYK